MSLLSENIAAKMKTQFEPVLKRAYEERWPTAQPLKFIHGGDPTIGMVAPRIGKFTDEQKKFVDTFRLAWGMAIERIRSL